MSFNINRRDWLKKSLIATAGLTAASTYIQRAQANPTVRRELQMSLSPDFQLENSFVGIKNVIFNEKTKLRFVSELRSQELVFRNILSHL